MTHVQGSNDMTVLLVGSDDALLEGLAQSFAALGYAPRVANTLHDARESANNNAPILVVVERAMASDANADTLGINLAPGGALVLYNATADERPPISPALQRSVLAELTLPLERARLIALAQHVQERLRATGRGKRDTPPEQRLP